MEGGKKKKKTEYYNERERERILRRREKDSIMRRTPTYVHTFENFPVEMREAAFFRASPEKFDVYDIFVNITRADW